MAPTLGAVLALGLLLIAPPLARAAPRHATSHAGPGAGTAAGARFTSLGGGTYQMTASVFGTDGDGQFGPGNTTSSGHVLQENDHLVALPACTESSCPWLGFDEASNDSEWGPNTGCIEDDGLCWVQLVSLDTGACTVAPVLDVGPYFRRDNWWRPEDERNYGLPQGVPATEAAIQDEDLGYGPGITDAGYDMSGDTYAPGVDIAAGTWQDLGLDPGQGVASVRITLLWQAGITHDAACGEGGGGDTTPGANASATDDLNLRDAPDPDADVVTVIPAGSRVAVTGGPDNGFYPVTYGGTDGWASADYLAFDDGGAGDGALTTDDVNLRAGPSAADDVLDVIPAGSQVSLTGDDANGYVAVSYQGEDGWVYQAYLAGDNVPASGGTARVASALNLRSGPSADADVLAVMPAGAILGLTGDSAGGYLSVSYDGTEGYAAADYLEAVTTDRLNLRADASGDGDVLAIMPAGASVQLTGNAANGYVSVTYQGEDGWAYVSYLSG